MTTLAAPDSGNDWLALSDRPLPVGAAADWVVLPVCGAVVLFSGTSRDHSGPEGTPSARTGVTMLEYEAYEDQVVPRLRAIVDELRIRWPEVGRVAVLHRTGPVPVGHSSVVIAVSAPHRADAFLGARFAIDTLKATVPIWKKEIWDGGSEWGLDAQPITSATERAAEREGVA